MFAVSVLAAFALAAAPLPDCRLNQAHWLGSHNSFKPVLPAAYYDTLATRLQQLAEPPARLQLQDKLQTLRYGHASLTSQLNSGLRLLELDFLKDDAGGSFARPLFGAELKQALLPQTQQDLPAQYFPATLTQPGFKVLHLPDIDFASHCAQARDCIATLVQWSKTNPGHWPVLIVINVREQRAGGYLPAAIAARVSKVESWQATDYQALEQLWLDGLGRERLLTPDDVRKAPLSLAASVQQHGWPTLKQAAGRFLLLFDGSPAQLALYRSGHPSLQGRLMFGNYAADTDEAAIRVLNDPATEQAEIASALALGLLVRTRSDDGNVLQPARFQAALTSGAQFISSDFYAGAPQGEPELQFRLPDGPFTAVSCQTRGAP
ncbi:MAG: hypothetical protein E6Q75_13160 [Rheinheimera sp.]|nr:MAG: hypothetical protein E6Q75_13160 [Rheinheimera sp.]